MRRLRVRQKARAEVAAAFAWYLERSPAAAQQFLEAVDEAMRLIEAAPERHPVIRGRLRRVLLRRFPYGVYYKVIPRQSVWLVSFMATGTRTRGWDGLRPNTELVLAGGNVSRVSRYRLSESSIAFVGRHSRSCRRSHTAGAEQAA